MEESFAPDFKSTESDSYKLYLYVESIRYETEARLKYIENQLKVIRQLQKGGNEN